VIRWDQRHVNLNKTARVGEMDRDASAKPFEVFVPDQKGTKPFQVDGDPINRWAENSNNRMCVRGQFKPTIDGVVFTYALAGLSFTRTPVAPNAAGGGYVPGSLYNWNYAVDMPRLDAARSSVGRYRDVGLITAPDDLLSPFDWRCA
jgi:hypothetical protein